MTQQITYEQAAAILGCHLSYVAKLVVRGELTASGEGSFDRVKVEALAARRTEEQAARATRPPRE